ncbi:hypothetical protein EYZ11_013223 [Aspergillus tanneri]|uniref:Uncharacterized protein n=1 Tax=Aspergillus tanneri TaxID=1220188 RepID=A0A4V3UMH5_9EURO|nr:hypothetical protein EYZ11_013223 [Aspergillus tanneri]
MPQVAYIEVLSAFKYATGDLVPSHGYDCAVEAKAGTSPVFMELSVEGFR